MSIRLYYLLFGLTFVLLFRFTGEFPSPWQDTQIAPILTFFVCLLSAFPFLVPLGLESIMSSLQDPYYESRDKLQNAVDKISTTFEGVKATYESGRYTPDITAAFQSLEFDLRNVKKEAKSLRKVG